MNTAIVVAAGSGKRFESSTPKQFLNLLGKPVIFHYIEHFDRCPHVDEIVVVVPIAGSTGSGRFERIRLHQKNSNL
jgi:2-C-methyl-D-erythritol 4-phosphate cytidylyltransferase